MYIILYYNIVKTDAHGYKYKCYGNGGAPVYNGKFNILKEYIDKIDVEKDGNCLCRAISGALWGNEDYHINIRNSMVIQLLQYPALYSPFVSGDYNKFVKRIGKPGQWYVQYMCIL